MAEELRAGVLQRIEELHAEDFESMMKEYNEKLFARNRMVTLQHEEQLFNTTITGVSPSGQLITQDTQKRLFNFDEVKYLKFL